MQNFDYVRASTVAEVVSYLSTDGPGSMILCGGTDLIVQLREGRRTVQRLIDIKTIPDVNAICYDPVKGLSLGAAAPCQRICAHAEMQKWYPGVIDAVSLIGGTQIQSRASLGGNLCNASPAADSIPALIVHRAVCLIAGPAGTRLVPVEQFCTAPGETVLQPGEFLLALQLPPPPPNFGARYLRFIPRNEMDIAVAGVGAAITLEADGQRFETARLALAAVAPTPLFVAEAGKFLAGQPVSDAVIQEAARLARQAARPISDLRGTAAQRLHLVEVLTRRALHGAVDRARGVPFASA